MLFTEILNNAVGYDAIETLLAMLMYYKHMIGQYQGNKIYLVMTETYQNLFLFSIYPGMKLNGKMQSE
ncbi:hypothetical protein VNO80_17365 [Phaseolus coccineus]|uniref:Uncharacterized protein n=1 Tax=Phaseolus coccineus TaxID=3886 RepID=A0AAN9MNH4_PHACN